MGRQAHTTTQRAWGGLLVGLFFPLAACGGGVEPEARTTPSGQGALKPEPVVPAGVPTFVLQRGHTDDIRAVALVRRAASPEATAVGGSTATPPPPALGMRGPEATEDIRAHVRRFAEPIAQCTGREMSIVEATVAEDGVVSFRLADITGYAEESCVRDVLGPLRVEGRGGTTRFPVRAP